MRHHDQRLAPADLATLVLVGALLVALYLIGSALGCSPGLGFSC